MIEVRRNSFTARHLDPASHMGEILFGLIMTLTFTLAAGIVIQEEGREGAREMLIGILGCNLAWGIIDGVLYVLGQVFERGRLRRIGVHVRQATSEAAATRVVADELDETLVPVSDESARQRFYGSVLEHVRSVQPAPNYVRREDVLGGLAAGWVVFACSFPAVLPFLLLDEPHFALRVSNAILLGLLFFVGWRFARHTLAKPWIAGATFLLVGLLLVALAIPLGG
jgi:VIT1/CCC1 family predicted Fe2+/Mn2+ transporter